MREKKCPIYALITKNPEAKCLGSGCGIYVDGWGQCSIPNLTNALNKLSKK